MRPGLVLVVDPEPGRARRDAVAMVHALGAEQVATVRSGRGWGAAAVPPPAKEATCGGDVFEDGDDVLVWSGELFLPDRWARGQGGAPRALSRGLLEGLRRHGVEALAEVDGTFVGAWYDGGAERWRVFGDRVGLLQAFWWVGEDGAGSQRLVVSPRSWLTWKASGSPLRMDGLGVAHLLRTQNMVGDRTLIQGVHWLEGGQTLDFDGRRAVTRRYWTFTPRDPEPGAASPEEGYLEAMRGAVWRCARSDGRLMLGISGGLDSRMILALCEEAGRLPDCYTVGWKFDEDVRFGRRLARVAGASHEWLPLTESGLVDRMRRVILATEGLHGAASQAPGMVVHDWLTGHPGAVVLEGYLHGVLGGAYVPEDEQVPLDRPAHEHPWARTRLHGGGAVEVIDGLLQAPLALESRRLWEGRIDELYRTAPVSDRADRAEYTMLHGRSGRLDAVGTALLRDDVLVRTPACDGALLRWAERTPARLGVRRGKRIFLEVFRQRFPKYARVQRTNYSGLPISESRWLREYHWQAEKLRRWWVGRQHPWTRRWGIGGAAIRAWAFEGWLASGELDVLRERDARVLAWVRAEPLKKLWEGCLQDPLKAPLLMNLATVEVFARWLERVKPGLEEQHAVAVNQHSAARNRQS